MKYIFFRRAAWLFAFPVAVFISGCTKTTEKGGASPASGTAQELVIVSPHSADIQTEFERAFVAKNPGVRFRWLDQGGSSNALRSVVGDFKGKGPTEGIGMDLFFGGGAETFLDLEAQKLLQPLPSEYGIPASLGGVPLRSPKRMWTGAVLSGFGIIANKEIAARDKLPLPQRWSDLADAKLKDRVVMADPRQSGVGHMVCEIILQSQGWDKGWQTLNGIAANSTRWSDSSSGVPDDVASGEAAFGPVIDFYAATKIAAAGKDKLGYIESQGESLVSADPIGILRGAPNKALAEKFVAFVLSPEGQRLWMLPKGAEGGPQNNALFRRPISPSLYPLPKNALVSGNPYAQKTTLRFDSSKSSARRRALDDLIGAVLIDRSDEFKAGRAKNPNDTFAWTPISEKELSALSAKWDDATLRNETISKWGAAARAQWAK